MKIRSYTFSKQAQRLGYRSGLEQVVAEQLERIQLPFEYESKDRRISYEKPSTQHKYTPDFTFGESKIIIETKGYFTSADRKKMKLVKTQNPEFDVRFVFSNSNTKIGKKSNTTYAMWCDMHGFKYADKVIPAAWVEEIRHDIRDSRR